MKPLYNSCCKYKYAVLRKIAVTPDISFGSVNEKDNNVVGYCTSTN